MMIRKKYFLSDNKIDKQILYHLKKEIKLVENIENITFGCSHTWGFGIEEEHAWPCLLKNKHNVSFINAARPGIGIYHIVTKDIPMLSGLINFNHIKRVVIQIPVCLRYPWWNAEEKKYRKPHVFLSKFGYFTRSIILRDIFRKEKKLLISFVKYFPNAKLVCWHYFVDFVPIFFKYNSNLGNFCKKIGMQYWGIIVPDSLLKMVELNKYGWLREEQKALYKDGWIASELDHHPSVKHNEIIKNKVLEWVS